MAWVYQAGAHALEIEEVALLVDGVEVAKDRRNAFSGASLRDVVFTLTLPEFQPAAKFTLRARVRGSDGTDSRGELRLNGPL